MDVEVLEDNCEKITRTTSSASGHIDSEDPNRQTTTRLAQRLTLDLALPNPTETHPTLREEMLIATTEPLRPQELIHLIIATAMAATTATVETTVIVETIEAIATIEIEWTSTIDMDATTTDTTETEAIATTITTAEEFNVILTIDSKEDEKTIATTNATLSHWSTNLAAIFLPRNPSSLSRLTPRFSPFVLLIIECT